MTWSEQLPKGEVYWGVMWIDDESASGWMLLDQSIQLHIVDSITAAEDVYGEKWDKLAADDHYLVRLRLTPAGVPSDIAFAWTDKKRPKATGVMSYEESSALIKEEARLRLAQVRA